MGFFSVPKFVIVAKQNIVSRYFYTKSNFSSCLLIITLMYF